MKKLVLRPPQHPMVDHLLKYFYGILWADMGTGKTLAALYALSVLQYVHSGITLVTAPKKVALHTWPEEIRTYEDFKDMTLIPVIGTEKQRLFAIRTKANIYTINYENLPWLVRNLPKGMFFTNIIIDEATRIKGFRLRKGSVQAKALYALSRKAEVMWELTGTPHSNGLIDLWAQLFFVDKGERLGRTRGAYIDRWFNRINCGNFIKIEPRSFAIKEIPKKVKDICLSIKAKDWFDLKEPIVTNIEVVLPDSVMKMYKQMEREMYAHLSKEKYISGVNAAGKTMKCLQIASGGLYDENKKWHTLHNEKLDALESIVEEAAGTPILVAYHWKSDISRIKKRFPKSVPLSDNPKIIKQWNAGKIPLMPAHPMSAGHGLNLQHGGNILVYFSHWWAPEPRAQILERIGPTRQAQSGYDRPVYVYNIVARNTIDEKVLLKHRDNLTILESLTNATKVV